MTLTRLQPNFVVWFQNRRWRVESVNDCRAVIRPVEKEVRQIMPATGPNAGKVLRIESVGRSLSIGPESDLPIVGRWDPVKQEVVR